MAIVYEPRMGDIELRILSNDSRTTVFGGLFRRIGKVIEKQLSLSYQLNQFVIFAMPYLFYMLS